MAEPKNASAALLAGWLTARLGVKVKQVPSSGPGITGVEVRFGRNDVLRIDRPDGYLATLSRTGMSDRQLPLKRRSLGDLLAEELRRLDADQPYADALSAVTGEKGLDGRPAKREHVWRDPMRPAARRTAGRRKPAAKATQKRTSTTAKRSATTTKATTKTATKGATKKATTKARTTKGATTKAGTTKAATTKATTTKAATTPTTARSGNRARRS
jgi:hypothetical protein